ncbi:metal ABC transporter substrate-binding protein [Shouchella lehensis]|uniref:ABC transporter, metal-binding lipoprotein n=1 Tax=Shouchella lehensis G1 TaxID=1246626 RepID=A0A060LZW1_9BACI|nr:zinc ABC transporter substrate-binding protein [Shouchella lehensis]AIC93843.1 ABC transporter, metal-binding lipoprotein [Shouchella lehensis G1]
MKKTCLRSLGLVALVMVTACGNNQGADEDNDQLLIKTSIFPYEDWTKAIGGDFVNVENIVPTGADAHTYEPTPQEMIEVAEADLFIYNGAELEPFADSILSAIENQSVHVLEGSAQTHLIESDHDHEHDHDEHTHVSPIVEEGDTEIKGLQDHYHSGDSVTLSVEDDSEWVWYTRTDNEDWEQASEEPSTSFTLPADQDNLQVKAIQYDEEDTVISTSDTVLILIDDHDDHHHGDQDPHVWLDPIRSIEIAQSIRDTLTELLPEQEDYFNENFQTLEAQFHELDEAFVDLVETSQGDRFIVSHAGYGYWQATLWFETNWHCRYFTNK